MKDKIVEELIKQEYVRQTQHLELIASENVVSEDILRACGSIYTNKYAEGYSGRRYYGGCEFTDKTEDLAIERACKLFDVKYANVQPHSGSQANAAAYRALLPDGGKILAMQLQNGGHLTHGSSVSFSSKYYNFVFFDLDAKNRITVKKIEEAIKKESPQVLMIGYSSYPYKIEFAPIAELCKKYNIKLMVDMAHFAGLVAGGVHGNPCKYADIVTSTTHKTLRGPRGGLVLTNDEELIKKVNSAVFPFYQGGPLVHIIAAKAIAFEEAMDKSFAKYAQNIIDNTKACVQTLAKKGCTVSDSDVHLFLLNTKKSFGMTGLEAQKMLEACNITTNKNMLPNDDEKPSVTSGLRIGFAAMTTRGCTVEMAKKVANIIYEVLSKKISIDFAKIKVAEITKDLMPIPQAL